LFEHLEDVVVLLASVFWRQVTHLPEDGVPGVDFSLLVLDVRNGVAAESTKKF